MYQTPGPFWRAVLVIGGAVFVYTMGRFGLGRFGRYGPFWTLAWAVLAIGHFRPTPLPRTSCAKAPQMLGPRHQFPFGSPAFQLFLFNETTTDIANSNN